MPGSWAGPIERFWSPSGDSTLMMSAPMSPRIWVQTGPSTLMVRSTTRTPARGPAPAFSCQGPLSGLLSVLEFDAFISASVRFASRLDHPERRIGLYDLAPL